MVVLFQVFYLLSRCRGSGVLGRSVQGVTCRSNRMIGTGFIYIFQIGKGRFFFFFFGCYLSLAHCHAGTHRNFWNPSSVLQQSIDLLRTGIFWFVLQYPKDFQQFFKIHCWCLVSKGQAGSIPGPPSVWPVLYVGTLLWILSGGEL